MDRPTLGSVRWHHAGDEEVATMIAEQTMAVGIPTAVLAMVSHGLTRLDDRTPEERRALRRLRNDKRARSWTRSDNKRVEAAMANRY